MRRPETRLLTLTGVGGCGKTRLALQLAADLAPHYPQRTWLIELAPVADANLLPLIVATTIGLREIGSTDPVDALQTFLAPGPALLLLDNCEHLIEACAALVDTLLNACPELRVIATSREPLHVAGERQYRVPPLATPSVNRVAVAVESIAASPAVALFVNRAQDVLPAFRLTPDNVSIVARICVRLGGIPLALELAAARVNVLGIDQILSRLDDAFRLLNSGNRIAPTRHQTLRSALDWSQALLTDSERTVFRRLSVFTGEFQLATAESVCSDAIFPSAHVIEALMGLVNKSLVVAQIEDQSAWYHLLEPVRQYAFAHLEVSGELAGTRKRHADSYVTIAERGEPELHGPHQQAWLMVLEREQNNLRTALEWGQREDVSLALRLSSALVPFWEANGQLIEGQQRLRQAVALPAGNIDPAVRMKALRGVGRLTLLVEDHDSRYLEAEAFQRESLGIAQAIGDRRGMAAALTELGMVYRLLRDLDRSADVLTEALTIFRELDDPPGIALALLNLGATLGFLADIARSIRLLTESLERFQALGDLRSSAITQVLLSRALLACGDSDQAIHLSVAALTTHAGLSDRWFVAFDLLALAEALIARDQPQQAIVAVSASQAVSVTLGNDVGTVSFSELFANIEAFRYEVWFEQAWTEGLALDVGQAVARAREMLTYPTKDQPAERSADSFSALLTRREIQVARYLAGGYTDRQIADQLFVTAGTVGNHVHSILRKLELSSRVQVAGWLATHGQLTDTSRTSDAAGRTAARSSV